MTSYLNRAAVDSLSSQSVEYINSFHAPVVARGGQFGDARPEISRGERKLMPQREIPKQTDKK